MKYFAISFCTLHAARCRPRVMSILILVFREDFLILGSIFIDTILYPDPPDRIEGKAY